MVTILDNKKKSEMEVSAGLVCYCWTLGIEFNKSFIFVDYQTSKLQYNY